MIIYQSPSLYQTLLLLRIIPLQPHRELQINKKWYVEEEDAAAANLAAAAANLVAAAANRAVAVVDKYNI